jgi:DNA-binding MarR family transcriptional regulator
MPSRRPADSSQLEAQASDLMHSIGLLLRRVRSESGAPGLSWSQATALGRLDRTGAMTTADLARAEMVKPQSMGTLLAELEADGLVRRQPHPTDGRQILFSLTDAGVAARRQRQAARLAWLTTALAGFDAAERRTLVDAVGLMQRLAQG